MVAIFILRGYAAERIQLCVNYLTRNICPRMHCSKPEAIPVTYSFQDSTDSENHEFENNIFKDRITIETVYLCAQEHSLLQLLTSFSEKIT